MADRDEQLNAFSTQQHRLPLAITGRAKILARCVHVTKRHDVGQCLVKFNILKNTFTKQRSIFFCCYPSNLKLHGIYNEKKAENYNSQQLTFIMHSVTRIVIVARCCTSDYYSPVIPMFRVCLQSFAHFNEL